MIKPFLCQVKKNFKILFIFRERGREGEREGAKERERNINWLPLAHAMTGDRTHNPGTYPDQESNRQLFTLWDKAQPTEPHRSWCKNIFLSRRKKSKLS